MTVLIREDTGEMAVVRVIDPGVHVSAPYSRAVGRLERWVADERHAVDEFAAWIEGQAAQAHAEMRLLCDELGLPVAWAEVPDEPPTKQAPSFEVPPNTPTNVVVGWTPRRPSDVLAEMYDERAVQAYMDADTSDDVPGRDARTPRPVVQSTPWWRTVADVLGKWVRL
jgi:hypothetical protein